LCFSPFGGTDRFHEPIRIRCQHEFNVVSRDKNAHRSVIPQRVQITSFDGSDSETKTGSVFGGVRQIVDASQMPDKSLDRTVLDRTKKGFLGRASRKTATPTAIEKPAAAVQNHHWSNGNTAKIGPIRIFPTSGKHLVYTYFSNIFRKYNGLF
jgi:hypothetical protein